MSKEVKAAADALKAAQAAFEQAKQAAKQKRKEAAAQRQKDFVDKQRKEGKIQLRIWLTPEEKTAVNELLSFPPEMKAKIFKWLTSEREKEKHAVEFTSTAAAGTPTASASGGVKES